MDLLHVSTVRRGFRRARVSLAVLALVPLAVAACGGSRSPGVAKLTTTTTQATTPAAASGTALERWAACMRSHGLPQFPEPTDHGKHFQLVLGSGGINKDSPQYRSASATCASLEPPAMAGPVITASEQVDYLRAAACMRAHDVPNFPDPTFVGGHVHFNFPAGLTQNSPHVATAIATCRKLIPAGLPYGGTG